MKRRDFLKASLLGLGGTVLLKGTNVFACGNKTKCMGKEFTNIIYTKDNPGRWAKKVGSHAPVITVKKDKVTVETKHPMSEGHFIVRHTLVLKDGTVLGAKTFKPTDKPVSEYTLPKGYKGKIYATSFCNLHDFWLSEATV
ncbi:superoxide reductase [Thermotomaculum hydrothermale]|uniref:Superoxide reductase n=1 Tax=Thermotomaculum hydrothermale TaxID=981385 RepID=A0A7R6SZZ0_9BACT|nr:desulfoferrodoxin family protein [Thermotomaculum hydrothermale]BBB33270.1 superoxide reductase [Thermotomaculum hydrothermale]